MIGLLAYLLFVSSALWYSVSSIRQVNDGVCSAVVIGATGALVATGFHNLFDVLYVHGMAALIGLLMAFVPAARRAGGERAAQVPRES